MSEMLAQIEQAKKEAKDVETEELPQGASPLEARAETAEVEGEVAAESEAQAESTEAETSIRIGDQTFKSQAEAFKYAEQLERDKTNAEMYNQGLRDALQSTATPVPVVEPEDNFEERFYSDPKKVIKETRDQAVVEALSIIKAEQNREKQWEVFSGKYPDVRRKDAERVLSENWETIGKMTDLDKAMGAMASKVRAEYDEIENLRKPRTELAGKKGQVVSRSGGSPTSVTQQKKNDEPIDFVSQMRKLKKQG